MGVALSTSHGAIRRKRDPYDHGCEGSFNEHLNVQVDKIVGRVKGG